MELIYMQGLYWFALVFILGLLLSVFASRIRLPDVLLLILLGLVLNFTGAYDVSSLAGSHILAAFSIFALIMIVFDSTSEFKLKEVNKLSPYAAKLALAFLVLCIIFIGLFTFLFLGFEFNLKSILLCILFASIVCGTAPDVILSTLGNIKSKIINIIKFESIINTPLTVIIPLVVMDFYMGVLQFHNFVFGFLAQIMTGVGTGMVVGFAGFSLMRKDVFKKIVPLLTIGIVVGTYALAEYLKGNGILAITALGLIFGKWHIEKKVELRKFLDLFATFLKIIVFILLGLMIKVPLTFGFFVTSFGLFLIYLLVRFYSVKISFIAVGLNFKEKLFMTLNIPKGIAVAVVAFILSTLQISALEPILSLVFAFIFYSIVLSSLVGWTYKWFIKSDIVLGKDLNTKKRK